MYKDKLINIPMLVIGLIGFGVAFTLGELLFYFLSPMPLIIQAGLYLLFAAILCGLVIIISETYAPGGYMKDWREKFAQDSLRAWLVSLPVIFIIGLVTQYLYSFTAIKIFESTKTFQGTFVVCDISASMLENDPGYNTVDAMRSYIDEIPIGEYLGLIVYTESIETLRPYSKLCTEDERSELKEEIIRRVAYNDGTDTQSALFEAIKEIRTVPGDYPGMILLFSDGQCEMNFNKIQAAARGIDSFTEIPVNTVYYDSNWFGSYQLGTVSQITGGVFNYLDTKNTTSGVFSNARASYSTEKLFLLNKAYGDKKGAPIRILLQFLFISFWCIAMGILVVVMLDNQNLKRDFMFFRIIASILTGVIFTVLMIYTSYNGVPFVRLLPMFCMLVIFLPTYRMYT